MPFVRSANLFFYFLINIFICIYSIDLVYGFHQYNLPRSNQNNCPVRIHSNKIHQQSAALNFLSLQYDKYEGELLSFYEQDLHPDVNNSGILSSDNFIPNEFSKYKCQFIFLGAVNEHVQIIFYKFNLFTFQSDQLNKTKVNLRYYLKNFKNYFKGRAHSSVYFG